MLRRIKMLSRNADSHFPLLPCFCEEASGHQATAAGWGGVVAGPLICTSRHGSTTLSNVLGLNWPLTVGKNMFQVLTNNLKTWTKLRHKLGTFYMAGFKKRWLHVKTWDNRDTEIGTCFSASFRSFWNLSSSSTPGGRSVSPWAFSSSSFCLKPLRACSSSLRRLCRVRDAWRSSSRSRDVRTGHSCAVLLRTGWQTVWMIRKQTTKHVYYVATHYSAFLLSWFMVGLHFPAPLCEA